MHGFVLLQREKQKNGPHEQRAVFSQEQSLKAMHSLIEIRVYNVVIGLRTYTVIPIWRAVWIVRKAAILEFLRTFPSEWSSLVNEFVGIVLLLFLLCGVQ